LHVELIVPGLLAAPPELRLPALELLLARARETAGEAQGLHAWLGEAFGIETEAMPAGALTASEPGFWLRADPVHLRVMRDRLVLAPVTGLERAEAQALVAALNRHFAGTHEFRAARPGAWVLRTAPAALDTLSATEMAGRDIDPQLPGGQWPALLNEIQMVLHEHPVNEARLEPVNSVWLWGAGELPAKAAGPWRSITAEEPVALGLARLAGIAHRAPARSAEDWLAGLPADGRHLVLLEAQHAELESSWGAPLLAALMAGRLGMLSLHAPDAGLSFEVARNDLRRFWRRARAVASHAPG
jgi:hypothetical protein